MKYKYFLLLLPFCMTLRAAPIDPHDPPTGLFSDDWQILYLADQKADTCIHL